MQGGERLCRRREDKQHTQQHSKKHLLFIIETLIRHGSWLGVQKGHGSPTFFSRFWEATIMFGVAFSAGMKGEVIEVAPYGHSSPFQGLGLSSLA